MIFISLVILISIALLALASIEDLKTGEIPEKISHSLIISTLVISILASIMQKTPTPFSQTIGLGFLYFTFAYIIYRLGQWGGGDVKLMAGIGCALGLIDAIGYQWPNVSIMPYSLTFIIDMGFLALPYAIIYSIFITVKKPEVLIELASYVRDKKIILLMALSFIPTIASYYGGYETLSLVYLIMPAVLLCLTYLKAVEETALKKEIPVKDLVEGDVLVNAPETQKSKITLKHTFEGLSQAQVIELKRLVTEGLIPEKIQIRWGIKFAPILLLSFAASVWLGNALEIIFSNLPKI